MKLSELTVEELNNLFNLMISFSDYIGKQMRLNASNDNRYNQWFNINTKLNDKLKMLYSEINKRIDSIKE